MLKLNAETLKETLTHCSDFQTGAVLREVGEWLTFSGPANVDELCEIQTTNGDWIPGKVVSSSDDESRVMLFRNASGIRPGNIALLSRDALSVPAGDETLGRVFNALGEPIDGLGPTGGRRIYVDSRNAPCPMSRNRIRSPLSTGQRVIDGFLTIGKGQRMGLFAGSGVGKSTLMGEIAKRIQSDLNVIALVGERGREVIPFVEDALGQSGLERSVVVVATAEEPALARVQAVDTALRIAEDFRSQGRDVMFFLDSITRLAHAQREIGLGRGEPPGSRGYPASVFRVLAQTLERMGNETTGSITGLITVLVDGDDLMEPIADAARSVLDGHIVLSRKLAEANHFPAVDVLASVSRLFREVTSPEQQAAIGKLRQQMAMYSQMEELLRMGLYQRGTSPETDEAVDAMPRIRQFCEQAVGEFSSYEETVEQLMKLSRQTTQTVGMTS
ncbi:MAG: FliI/YscN family ATPase [Planctomycetaceae bacterium]|nr:FliI/YscN family ATPase [Planctomycetaceae bacterium]